MKFTGFSFSLAIGIVAAAAPAATAHVQIKAPKQRNVDQKKGPCGLLEDMRSANVCEFQPGATIAVAWDETVEHPGHFRISFDEDGTDGFIDPDSYTDFDNSETVLQDNIEDRAGGDDGYPRYSFQVTLPDVECDNCTLQLIQVMTDKPPYGDGNDIYFQCADLVLSADAPAEPAPGCGAEAAGDDAGPGGGDPDAGDGDGSDSGGENTSGDDSSEDSGGCAAAGGAATGLPAALLIGLAVIVPLRLRRRRNRRRGAAASPRR